MAGIIPDVDRVLGDCVWTGRGGKLEMFKRRELELGLKGVVEFENCGVGGEIGREVGFLWWEESGEGKVERERMWIGL